MIQKGVLTSQLKRAFLVIVAVCYSLWFAGVLRVGTEKLKRRSGSSGSGYSSIALYLQP